jgi:hypothetical protein
MSVAVFGAGRDRNDEEAQQAKNMESLERRVLLKNNFPLRDNKNKL